MNMPILREYSFSHKKREDEDKAAYELYAAGYHLLPAEFTVANVVVDGPHVTLIAITRPPPYGN